MGRAPCCDKGGVKKGAWSPEEDQVLVQYIKKHGGHGSWRSLPHNAGLLRCGKSCRLRWTNYLRPDIKRGPFTPEEEATIIQLHGILGNKWAAIASKLPGRTDNEVKNFWNTHLKKRLFPMDQKLQIQQSFSSSKSIKVKCESPSTRHMIQWESARVEAEARLSMESLLVNPSSMVKVENDYFLQLWNSEVGESFRKIKGDGRACKSPVSTSSFTKFASGSVDNTEPIKASTSNDTTHLREDGGKTKVDVMASSDSISSSEFADSSDTALNLLLDFSGGNDMEFIQGSTQIFQLS